MSQLTSNSNSSDFKPTGLLNIYKQAVKNIPVLRYSWVLIATICILALAAYFKLKNSDVFIYAVFVIVISFFAFLFSFLLKTKDKFIRYLLYGLVSAVVMTLGIAVLGFGSFIIWEKPEFYKRWFPRQTGTTNDSGTVKMHFEFHPKSPVALEDSVEIKATVLDEQNKVIDVPVSWKIKEEEDADYISISQRDNIVKVTRKPNRNSVLPADPLIIELIAKVSPLSDKQEPLVDGVNIMISNSKIYGIFNRSPGHPLLQISSLLTQAFSLYPEFVNTTFSKEFIIPPPQDSVSKRPVVYLIDTRVSLNLVYMQKTRDLGVTNSHDISIMLKDLPVDDRIETVHKDWDRSKRILDAKPDLIIIHWSCFYTTTNALDEENKFRDFLQHMVKANNHVQFLIYSRSPSIIEQGSINGQRKYLLPYKYETKLKIPGLSDRIHPFKMTPAPNSFCDASATLKFKGIVKSILKLP